MLNGESEKIRENLSIGESIIEKVKVKMQR
jgi:hypothetical protein